MPSLVKTGFFPTLSTLVWPSVEEGKKGGSRGEERPEGEDICKMKGSVERTAAD